MTLIDRDSEACNVVVPNTKKSTLQAIAKPLWTSQPQSSQTRTSAMRCWGKHFAGHHVVDHSREFVRAVIMHTNFAESYHSLLKRGLFSTFHHVSEKHLPRHLNEFEFRWNSRETTDGDRTNAAIAATGGKRLTDRGSIPLFPPNLGI